MEKRLFLERAGAGNIQDELRAFWSANKQGWAKETKLPQNKPPHTPMGAHLRDPGTAERVPNDQG